MAQNTDTALAQKKQLIIYCLTAGFAIMAGILYWAAKQGMLPMAYALGIMAVVLIADFFAAKKMFQIIESQAD
jgi:hypothetical protein